MQFHKARKLFLQHTSGHYEKADMEVCTKYYFLKENAMKQGSEVAYNAEVNVDRIDIITDYIPLPEAINILKTCCTEHVSILTISCALHVRSTFHPMTNTIQQLQKNEK